MGGGGVGGGEGDPKPSESLLTKWSEKSKGNYSTTMHSSSGENRTAPGTGQGRKTVYERWKEERINKHLY